MEPQAAEAVYVLYIGLPEASSITVMTLVKFTCHL